MLQLILICCEILEKTFIHKLNVKTVAFKAWVLLEIVLNILQSVNYNMTTLTSFLNLLVFGIEEISWLSIS